MSSASPRPRSTRTRRPRRRTGRRIGIVTAVVATLSLMALPAQAASETSADTPAIQCGTETIPAEAGTPHLTWGIKSSFVGYLQSAASGGKITTSGGAAQAGVSFTWGDGSGSLDDDGAGTLTFPGAVHFTAHDGVLDTALSHLRITTNADGTGTLVADVSSKNRQGEDVSADDVTFATLTYDSLSPTGGVAQVALTKAGATAFAGFYEAGESLDDLTIDITGGHEAHSVERCRDENGTLVDASGNPIGNELSYTGVNTTQLLAAGLGILALGALMVVASRRRSAAAHR